MRRKETGCYIALIPVVMIGIVIGVFLIKNALDRQAKEKSFLAPFHEVYDVLREKYPSIKSISEHLGAGDRYCMYYIECDIAENTDCFAEFVDIQCEINALMDAEKDDEWFSEFDGHIDIYTDCRRLRVFYHNGSMNDAFLAEEIISDNYNVLWDAFPDNDELSLTIWLTDYSDEIKSEIIQKNEGRNITVEPQLGE